MKFIYNFMLISFIVKEVPAFKIDIEDCTTSDGKKGFCREERYCIYKGKTKFEACADKNMVCCPDTGISHKMCLKYAEAVFQKEDAVVSLPFRRKTDKVDQCGMSAVPLIIGGEKAKETEFPHMAAIGFGHSYITVMWSCGGSLISPNYILTAAHCLDAGRRGPAKWVLLGTTSISNFSFFEPRGVEVEKRIYHPEYRIRENDIALLKLKMKVEFTQFTRPACLDYANLIKGSKAIATGWGKTNFDAAVQSDVLMKVTLDLIGKGICSKTHKQNRFMPRGIDDSKLCAGVLTGGKDTCQGDSGGPLQIILDDPYCMYGIIGVTSFGKFCGFRNSPAIYTRVFTFLPWIESIVWPNIHEP